MARPAVPVELEQELLQHLRRVASGAVLDVERLAVHDGAVAHAEDLRVGARLGLIEADHVERLSPLDARRLALVHVSDRGEPVAQQRGLLELLRRSRGGHLTLDAMLHVAQPAAQKIDRLPHDLHVIVVRDAGVAGRQRALDEVLQARRAAPAPGLDALALAVREDAPDELRDLTDLAGAGIRPEVQVAGQVPPAEEAHPRPLVAHRDLDEGIALVVAQPQVVRRPRLLDEVVLEEQRLPLGGRDDPLDVACLGEHLGGAPVRRAAAPEVRGHALAQLLRLPDVEHLTVGPEKAIHARAVGDAGQDAAQVVGVAGRSG